MNLNAHNNKDQTALFYAAMHDCFIVFKCLLKFKADSEIIDCNGCHAMHFLNIYCPDNTFK